MKLEELKKEVEALKEPECDCFETNKQKALARLIDHDTNCGIFRKQKTCLFAAEQHFPAFVELLAAASNLVVLRKLPHDLFCDTQKSIKPDAMKCTCGLDELIKAIAKVEEILK